MDLREDLGAMDATVAKRIDAFDDRKRYRNVYTADQKICALHIVFNRGMCDEFVCVDVRRELQIDVPVQTLRNWWAARLNDVNSDVRRGRPTALPLGQEVELLNTLRMLRSRGRSITAGFVSAVAKGIVEKYNAIMLREHGGALSLSAS